MIQRVLLMAAAVLGAFVLACGGEGASPEVAMTGAPDADGAAPSAVAPSATAAPLSTDGDRFYLGFNLGEGDSPEAVLERTGIRPQVLVGFFHFPFREQDRQALAAFLETAGTNGAVALVTLEPHEGLASVTDEATDEMARIASEANADGVSVMLRFAHEMNGSWYAWSQQPEAYVRAFRALAAEVHARAPLTSMLWAPNYGGGYPFAGGPYETTPGEAGFEALDTDGDGRLSMADDPYAPYYPGDDAVDWAGMSLYHWGSAYPWGENELPEAGKFVAQLRGEYLGLNGDDTAVPDFYAVYAEEHGKPIAIPETAALYDPAQAGDEAEIKRLWWEQVFSREVRASLPHLRMVNWFEHRKAESEVGGAVIDWRATGTPELAQAFASHVEAWLAARGASD